MNFTIILLTAACLTTAAAGHTQVVTLSLKDAPMEKAFSEIEKQTGYYFTYTVEQLRDTRSVNLNVINANLLQVLDLCFKDQPLTYKVFDKVIVVQKKVPSSVIPTPTQEAEGPPPIDVTGRVTDSTGAPLEGASVRVRGTKQGTSTDANGFFILKGVDENATIEISYQGFELYSVKASENIGVVRLKMKENVIEQVVVKANTGYEEVAPNKINGSVFIVTKEMLNQQVGTNILQRLDGMASGLTFHIGKLTSGTNPQSNTGVVIRGHSTILGTLDPLIVLDNFPYEGDINNINPNDVESVTILKDAAATSIWGARGGNGVIVITTSKGRFNSKLKVNFNSNIIVTESPDLFSLNDMSVDEYVDVEEYLFNRGYFNTVIANNTTRPGLAPASEIFLKRRNGLISAADSASQINALRGVDSRDQYNKFFYRDALTQTYSLNLSGGSGNIAWLISGGYDKSISELQAKKNKINLRLNNTYKPFKNLQINIGVLYTNSMNNDASAPTYNSIKINNRNVAYLKFADDNGNALPVAQYYREIYTDTAGVGKLLDWKYYPLEDYKHDNSIAKLEDITANFGITYQPFKFLSATILYQYQQQKSSTEGLADLESFKTRDAINRFTQLDRTTGVVTYIVPKGSILTLANSYVNSQSLRGQLAFQETWLNKHEVSAILGTEIREAKSGGNRVTNYGYTKDPLTYGNVDFVNRYPVFNRTTTASIPGSPYFSPDFVTRFVSLYTNASYTYLQKYSVSLSARRDGANIFGATTNDKWKPLWSAGLGWEISKERFYNIKTIPFLKIRATVGYSGLVDVSRIPLPIGTYSSFSTVTTLPYMTITQINDPSLRWEKVRQINFGLDFSSKGQIFSGSIEYYIKNGLDLYGPGPFNYTAGFNRSTVTKNAANMQGKGIDLTLTTKNIDRAVKWTTSFLISYREERVTRYLAATPLTESSLGSNNAGKSITPVVGRPLYAIAAYKWYGLNSGGDPQGMINGQLTTNYSAINNDRNLKGIEGENLVYIGSAVPIVFGSVMNSLSWQGFSASVNITYKAGYYFRKEPLSYSTLFVNGIGHGDFSNRWKKPGDELYTTVPAMVYTDYQINGAAAFDQRDNFYRNSELHVLRADHVRLQFVNFSYTHHLVKKKSPIANFQLYMNIANLGIIWRANKYNLDPDYSSGFAPSKQFAFGVRANF